MPKNICIFCDGTWNSPADEAYGVPSPTNVYRLFEASQGQAESDGKQITWYQPGVGALGGPWRRALEGATGTGIGANIRRAYMAIARHYEPNDKIFLFGFSRGAFTARSVAGMIERVGLIEKPTKQLAAQAYANYRKTGLSNEDAKLGKVVRVHFVGIWDTVGALGFPMWGWSFNLLPFFGNSFHELSPNQITDFVYHGLAMDEIRTSFMPTLWEEPPPETQTSQCPKVEQVWFRGVHSDVGGGYPDHELADITLSWMADCAKTHGLLIRENALSTLKPDPMGRIHNSYKGPLWGNVAGWPRWFPPLNRSPSDPDSTKFGYLHESIFEREKKLQAQGSPERPLKTLCKDQVFKFDVRADQLWNATNLILESGATYELTSEGWWQDFDDTPVDAEGQDPKTESWIKKRTQFGRRAPKEPWMKLIGVFNYPIKWPWEERKIHLALKYLIMKDPEDLVNKLMSIGKHHTKKHIDPGKTGLLWVFANDWWKYYDNNTGSVLLTVKRID